MLYLEQTTLGITFVLELRLRSESFLCSSLLFLRYPLEIRQEASFIIHRKIRQKISISLRIVWGLGLIYSLLTWTWRRRRGWWRRRCRWKRWTRTWTMRHWNLPKLPAPYLTPLAIGPICFYFFCHVIPRNKWCETILGRVSFFSRSTSYSCNFLHDKSFANILGQQPMKSWKNVPRLHAILVVHKAEIRKLLCQTYVLLSPCKIDIASRRLCPQLMVGCRSLCQVQRKATKGKPALPTPVRHTEGAKCCFERFIIETIKWYWHKERVAVAKRMNLKPCTKAQNLQYKFLD